MKPLEPQQLNNTQADAPGSSTPLLKKWVVVAFLVISFVGFLDATYLSVNHFLNKIPPCVVGGCEVVTTSQYAVIAGIPVALLGALYYLTVFLGTLYYVQTKNVKVLRRVAVVTFVGLLASIYFVALQVFVIKAYCLYCLGSAVTSTLLFVLGCYVVKVTRKG